MTAEQQRLLDKGIGGVECQCVCELLRAALNYVEAGGVTLEGLLAFLAAFGAHLTTQRNALADTMRREIEHVETSPPAVH